MRIWTVVRGHLARSVVASDLPPTKAQREELAAILTGAEL